MCNRKLLSLIVALVAMITSSATIAGDINVTLDNVRTESTHKARAKAFFQGVPDYRWTVEQGMRDWFEQNKFIDLKFADNQEMAQAFGRHNWKSNTALGVTAQFYASQFESTGHMAKAFRYIAKQWRYTETESYQLYNAIDKIIGVEDNKNAETGVIIATAVPELAYDIAATVAVGVEASVFVVGGGAFVIASAPITFADLVVNNAIYAVKSLVNWSVEIARGAMAPVEWLYALTVGGVLDLYGQVDAWPQFGTAIGKLSFGTVHMALTFVSGAAGMVIKTTAELSECALSFGQRCFDDYNVFVDNPKTAVQVPIVKIIEKIVTECPDDVDQVEQTIQQGQDKLRQDTGSDKQKGTGN